MTRLPDTHTFLSPNGPHYLVQARMVRFTPLALTLAVLFAALVWPDAAFARPRSNRNSAAAAAARKKKTVESLRAQVAAAQQVLAAAEAAGGGAQAQLDEMRSRISGAREAMTEALDEEREVRKDLRELEEEILADQAPESEFGRAQARLAAARDAADKLRTRYGADRSGLQDDPNYLAVSETLREAKREFDRVRAAVLAKDADWQDATKKLRDLVAEHREEQKAGGGALGMMPAARSLRSAQEIAAAARQVIALGEARLRQLGEKVAPSTATAGKNGAGGRK